MESEPIPPVEIPRQPVQPPPEKLFLFVCDEEDPRPQTLYGLQGAGQWQQGNYPVQTRVPQWRRATPDDLHAFGFVPIPPGIPEDPTHGAVAHAVEALMDRLPTKMRFMLMCLLKEKYG